MKACVLTLGCKMNEAESASLLRALEERGYETAETPCSADLYVVNTCAVTAEAEKKSRQAVARLRKFNPSAPVVVCGCAAQNHPAAFAEKEGVTLVSGAQGKDKLLSRLGDRGVFLEEDKAFCELPAPKPTRTRAFLRIQDGCNRFCSYCLIPYLRGRTRSRTLESVLAEARALPQREIVLTGIDISSYRDGERDLGALLRALSGLPARIRLGSLEPCAITREFLSAAREAGNVAPHFHLSLQSGSSRVLRAMNRRYTREEYLEKCALVCEYFPDAAITTDLIVGFPTEEEEDFVQTLSVLSAAGFARVHAFPFSPRAGTPAAKKTDLPAHVKRERMARLEEAAQAQEARYLARFLGREAVALFEEEGGYTENYLRVYAVGAAEGSLCRVKLLQRVKDGAKAEILEVL